MQQQKKSEVTDNDDLPLFAGTLFKRSRGIFKKWNQRFVQLTKKSIIIETPNSTKKPRIYDLTGSEIIPVISNQFDRNNVFDVKIKTPAKILTFHCISAAERADWISALKMRNFDCVEAIQRPVGSSISSNLLNIIQTEGMSMIENTKVSIKASQATPEIPSITSLSTITSIDAQHLPDSHAKGDKTLVHETYPLFSLFKLPRGNLLFRIVDSSPWHSQVLGAEKAIGDNKELRKQRFLEQRLITGAEEEEEPESVDFSQMKWNELFQNLVDGISSKKVKGDGAKKAEKSTFHAVAHKKEQDNREKESGGEEREGSGNDEKGSESSEANKQHDINNEFVSASDWLKNMSRFTRWMMHERGVNTHRLLFEVERAKIVGQFVGEARKAAISMITNFIQRRGIPFIRSDCQNHSVPSEGSSQTSFRSQPLDPAQLPPTHMVRNGIRLRLCAAHSSKPPLESRDCYGSFWSEDITRTEATREMKAMGLISFLQTSTNEHISVTLKGAQSGFLDDFNEQSEPDSDSDGATRGRMSADSDIQEQSYSSAASPAAGRFVRIPLCCTVDYMGMRIYAEASIPVPQLQEENPLFGPKIDETNCALSVEHDFVMASLKSKLNAIGSLWNLKDHLHLQCKKAKNMMEDEDDEEEEEEEEEEDDDDDDDDDEDEDEDGGERREGNNNERKRSQRQRPIRNGAAASTQSSSATQPQQQFIDTEIALPHSFIILRGSDERLYSYNHYSLLPPLLSGPLAVQPPQSVPLSIALPSQIKELSLFAFLPPSFLASKTPLPIKALSQFRVEHLLSLGSPVSPDVPTNPFGHRLSAIVDSVPNPPTSSSAANSAPSQLIVTSTTHPPPNMACVVNILPPPPQPITPQSLSSSHSSSSSTNTSIMSSPASGSSSASSSSSSSSSIQPLSVNSDLHLHIPLLPDTLANAAEVSDASKSLIEERLTAFSQAIDTMHIWPCCFEQLVDELHAAGLPLSLLGRLAQMTQLPHIRSLCEVEMVSRVFARLLRFIFTKERISLAENPFSEMPHRRYFSSMDRVNMYKSAFQSFLCQIPEDYAVDPLNYIPFLLQNDLPIPKNGSSISRRMMEISVDVFNLTLGTAAESSWFWACVIAPSVERDYGYVLSPQGTFHRPSLFMEMQRLTGITFRESDLYPLLVASAEGEFESSAYSSTSSMLNSMSSVSSSPLSYSTAATPQTAISPFSPSTASITSPSPSSSLVGTNTIATFSISPSLLPQPLTKESQIFPKSAIPSAQLSLSCTLAIHPQYLKIAPREGLDILHPPLIYPPFVIAVKSYIQNTLSNEIPTEGWLCVRRSKVRPISWDDFEKFQSKIKTPPYFTFLLRRLSECGTILAKTGNYNDSLQILNRMLDIARSSCGIPSRPVSKALLQIGKVHHAAGRDGVAEMYMKAALGASPAVYHGENAQILIGLIDVLFAQGKKEEGLLCAHVASVFIIWHLGPSHPLLVELALALAKSHELVHEYKRTMQHLERAAELSTKIVGSHHPLTTRCNLLMAREYRRRGEAKEAARLFTRALSITEAVLGENSMDAADVRFELAETLKEEGSLQQGLEAAKLCLASRKKILGVGDLRTLTSLAQTASLLAESGDYIEAVRVDEELLSALRQMVESITVSKMESIEAAKMLDPSTASTDSSSSQSSSSSSESNDDDFVPPASLIDQIQSVTREIVLLVFKASVAEKQAIVRAVQRVDNQIAHETLLAAVVSRLNELRPSEYVDSLLKKATEGDNNAFRELICVYQLVQGEELNIQK
ncbi:uncharacterized protein MONOS_10390 [Monocercomonoides exilis]|uniref:uncharacterized protein n=1 Tax=Monocercomonoides exilis TaxID=2049356 RepID=UPI00355998CA|nr:hypothetical protein MONOS_10390 [Monocercomonoides exilis]|eukprot:MONOS_10390.1-p1 / transcript=MONOS_10390.1 / gene=MONOS_10390 / organism=Monocercomonoides_exilis_PA203 / gene_product=unspecified product / transcript_product=unspecified product / location=Mono_scaffold00471:10811-16453(-) / protein_length=1764 / sequence_SO=supercontig / SO=protein_coding / is_pseudo=false